MRIPFPERVSINYTAIFAAVLFIIQRFEGTPLYFCTGCTVFILVAAFAFNAAGGLSRASGSYVFCYSLLVFIIGVGYKAFLGEPAQSNLADPQTDIEAYVGSISAMYFAVVVSRRFSRKTGLLENLVPESDMPRAAIGCMLFGALGAFAIALLGNSATSLQTAFAQLNELIPLGIIIGVMAEIRRSGGTRCTNLFITLGTVYLFFLGVTGFSKQGMIVPLYCWALPIAALRYRLSVAQILSGLLFVFIVFYYLVPVSQYGRNLVPEDSTLTQRAEIATRLLEHPNQTHRIEKEAEEEGAYEGIRGLGSYYNTPQGFWERLQFISVDDALNNLTDQGHIFGLLPIKIAFLNIIPHFIWPNKPTINLGNMYAHEISGEAQGEGDVTTSIAFSPTGEAYHLAGWTGIFVLAPILWCLLFIVFDTLLGDIRNTAWGLLALAIISHAAPEGGISYTIYLVSFGVEALVFCAFFAKWFAPAFAAGILGPDRRIAQPIHGRVSRMANL